MPDKTDWQVVGGQVLDTEERLTRLVDDLLELCGAETEGSSGASADIAAIVGRAVEAHQESAEHVPDLFGHRTGMEVDGPDRPANGDARHG